MPDETIPTEANATGHDLFGQPLPDPASADPGEQRGPDQDQGLTLSDDDWDEIEAVWANPGQFARANYPAKTDAAATAEQSDEPSGKPYFDEPPGN